MSELAWERWTQGACECSDTPEVFRPNSKYGYQPSRKLELWGKAAPRKSWYRLVELYTTLRLTYESDMLAALSGLAEKQPGFSGRYICGLWSDDFIRGLSWWSDALDIDATERRHVRQRQYIAPTWSWASVLGPIKFDFFNFLPSRTLEVLDIDFTLATSNLYGSVNHACVQMSGPLLPIRLDPDWSIHFDVNSSQDFPDRHESWLPLYGRIHWDVHVGEMAFHDVLVQKPLYLLVLMTLETEFGSRGIVLRATSVTSEIPIFERVGAWSSGADNVWCDAVDIAMDTTEKQIFNII